MHCSRGRRGNLGWWDGAYEFNQVNDGEKPFQQINKNIKMFVLTLIYVEHHQASKPLSYWMLQGHSFTDQELLMCLSANGGGESVTWFSHLAHLLLFLLTPFPISWKKMLFKNIKLCNVHEWIDFISAYISYNLSYYEISWVLSSLLYQQLLHLRPKHFSDHVIQKKKGGKLCESVPFSITSL